MVEPCFVELKLLEAPPTIRDDAGRQKGEHPPEIGGCHKMQGAAHRPGTDDRSVSNGLLYSFLGRVLHAQPNCPKRTEIILSLDGTEPSHHVAWFLETRACNMLAAESVSNDI